MRKGRFLELLIASLQSYLGPEGVEVRSPELFYDENGEMVGEVDVTLRGDLGAGRVFLGIECRDRPSSGPQGIDWIQLIVGKRESLGRMQNTEGPDKWIAVSTTGFTGPAEALAARQKIDLIVLEDTTEESLKYWLEVITLGWNSIHIEFLGELTLDPLTGAEPPPIDRLRFDWKDKMFFRPEAPDPKSIDDIARENCPASPPDLQDDTVTREVEFAVLGPWSLQFEDQRYQLWRIRFPARITFETYTARALLNLCRRLSDNKELAMTGIADLIIRGKRVKAFVLVKEEGEQKTRSVRVEFFDEFGNSLHLGDNVNFSLLAR